MVHPRHPHLHMAMTEGEPEVSINTTINKAVFAGLVSGVVAALTYLSPVIDDGLVVSEVLWAVALFLAGTGILGFGTYKIPNAKSPDRTTSTPEI